MQNDFRRPGQTKSSELSVETSEEETFKTPEEIAAQEDLSEPNAELSTANEQPSGWRAKFGWVRKPRTKREWGIALAVLLLIIGAVFYIFGRSEPEPVVYKKAPVKAAPKPPTTVASALSGLQVDPAFNNRPVTGVMIENSTDSRPQAGLGEAGVVFEAIAEGGITRFLALFQDTQPEVGPVRSARPYYLQWALSFDAGYAHVGGSPEALQNIKDWNVKDLDQFFNSGAYRREGSRIAPHNVYTNIPTLVELQNSKGYTSSKFTGFTRKKESKAKVPTAKTIDMNISGPNFAVHYDYDAATNSYNRVMAGSPHVDANNNAQIHPKVVIGLIVSYGLAADGHHSSYGTVGTGQALIYQDGGVTMGNWTKADNGGPLTFTDAAGKPLKLNPGQTWITALGSAGQVTHNP